MRSCCLNSCWDRGFGGYAAHECRGAGQCWPIKHCDDAVILWRQVQNHMKIFKHFWGMPNLTNPSSIMNNKHLAGLQNQHVWSPQRKEAGVQRFSDDKPAGAKVSLHDRSAAFYLQTRLLNAQNVPKLDQTRHLNRAWTDQSLGLTWAGWSPPLLSLLSPPDWLWRDRPKLLPLINQEPVSTSCTQVIWIHCNQSRLLFKIHLK